MKDTYNREMSVPGKFSNETVYETFENATGNFSNYQRPGYFNGGEEQPFGSSWMHIVLWDCLYFQWGSLFVIVMFYLNQFNQMTEGINNTESKEF